MKTNRLDDFFERIYSVVVTTKGSELLLENKEVKDLFFNVLIEKMLDIQAFSDLYTDTVLNAVDVSINNSLLEFKRSKYKDLINSSQFIDQVKASKHEFIRHAYVIGFHKFETFAKALTVYFDGKIKGIEGSNFTKFEDYSKSIFKLSLVGDWYKFKQLHIIQFICNSSKHFDGYPLSRHGKPNEFINSPEDVKIIRSPKEFRNDMKFLSTFTGKYFELFNYIMLYYDQAIGLDGQIRINKDAHDFISAGTFEPFDIEDTTSKLNHLSERIAALKNELLYPEYNNQNA